MSKYKTIPVSLETLERIRKLKRELGAETYDELINKLVDMFFQNKEFLIKKILCNDYRDSKLTVSSLKQILRKRNLVALEDFAVAIQYLKQVSEDEYVVDLSKCIQD